MWPFPCDPLEIPCISKRKIGCMLRAWDHKARKIKRSTSSTVCVCKIWTSYTLLFILWKRFLYVLLNVSLAIWQPLKQRVAFVVRISSNKTVLFRSCHPRTTMSPSINLRDSTYDWESGLLGARKFQDWKHPTRSQGMAFETAPASWNTRLNDKPKQEGGLLLPKSMRSAKL